MKLDYQEIMELPEPDDGADVGTMETICGVYAQLVAKFTRLLDEARQIKVCWLQEERVTLYAKRLAANQREYRCADKQRRQGEMFNFCLRVREWVLGNAERRLKMRALIGEARIAKWHDKKLIWDVKKQTSLTPNINRNEAGRIPIKADDCCPPAGNVKAFRRQEVRNWYRLPHFRKSLKTHSFRGAHINMSHLNMNHLNMDHLNMNHLGLSPLGKASVSVNRSDAGKGTTGKPAPKGMRRAMPAVVFWPDELALDYVHSPNPPQITPEKFPESPVQECRTRSDLKSECSQENTGKKLLNNKGDPPHIMQMDTHAAKEWPD